MTWLRKVDPFMRWSTLVISGFLVLATVVAVAGPWGDGARRPADATSPEAAVYGWLEAHRAGDVPAAYGFLSPAMQRTTTLDAYQRYDFAIFGWSRSSRHILVAPISASSSRARVRVAIGIDGVEIRQDGDGPGERSISVVLVPGNDGAWKIESVDPLPTGQRRRFSS